MPDGTVSYSQRLTLKADCPMQLQKFPFDSQVCADLGADYLSESKFPATSCKLFCESL